MSKNQKEMFTLINSVFGNPDSEYYDEDIAAMCAKKMATNTAQKEKSAKKLQLVNDSVMSMLSESEDGMNGYFFVSELVEWMINNDVERVDNKVWNSRSAGYYVRQMVKDGVLDDVTEAGEKTKRYALRS